MEAAVRTSYVEATAVLSALHEAGDRVDVVRLHTQFTASCAQLFDRDALPSSRSVHHVGLELVFFVPLQAARVAGRPARDALQDGVDIVGKVEWLDRRCQSGENGLVR